MAETSLTLVSRAVETREAVSVGEDEATLIDDGEVVASSWPVLRLL